CLCQFIIRLPHSAGGSAMTSVLIRPVGPDDHVRGPADAPITLVEYGDYECRHCGLAHVVLKQVFEDVGDEVRFVFRNSPIAEVHAHSRPAAEAAEAVAARGGQDAFWTMHDLLFENQDALQEDDLIEYAAAAGVDPVAVAEDLATAARRARVQRDVHSGMRSGVKGTPTFFVNGRRFEGDWTDPAALSEALRDGARGHTHTAH
ncbi:MAG TPA: DsbA family protein, partial [Vicinamibacterales bacterium]|nr:DsbA family protein [Vicinamibacterales bacterium]